MYNMTSTKPTSSKSDYHVDRCANPFKENGHRGKELRNMSTTMIERFGKEFRNSKICKKCRNLFYKNNPSNPNNSTNSAASDILEENIAESDDETNSSPLKKIRLSREQELEEFLRGIKEKFASLPVNDPLRISILTAAPGCWSIRKVAEEFGTSIRMAKKARDIRKTDGVFAMPTLKAGKKLPNITVDKVAQFYDSDVNSRVMPNKKDTVAVKINGEKQRVQKRLLLSDISNLHEEFKKLNPDHPIGLSKFAELRPKWCIAAGATGTHSVCVCTIHENFKNMIDASNLRRLTKDSSNPINDYNDCFRLVMCENPQPACFLNECTSCQNFEYFSTYIADIFEQRGIDEIIYSTWQTTDRCTLRKECLAVDDFIIELCGHLKQLIPHHFIAKNQSDYLSQRKNDLKETEVLVQMDFSENYAYVAQDAAQAFHYNNNQCTVHPAIFYYKCGNEMKHCSLIALSDSTTHDTAAVYLLQQFLIPEIKKVVPKVQKVIYATDGAKQHYKNRFQMCNLIHHKDDFNIDAEWHMHATAHGKGACDGLGAIFKREATRASLQAKPSEAILTPEALIKWATAKFKTTTIVYYNSVKHKTVQRHLAKRFAKASPVKNIQIAHGFVVEPKKTLKTLRYSSATTPLSIMHY